MAEWLCEGLQILLRRFNSGLSLHIIKLSTTHGLLYYSNLILNFSMTKLVYKILLTNREENHFLSLI